ncbi:MAG: alpha-L-rhamnosidase [Lachnospiraceae bacterium]|nr:alpha-L-rhamnosidase [Lachnospiraceae bacterium]
MKNAVWIWYPGDFELYHGMKQNFRREERGLGWPAFWKMDDWRKNLRFFRKYELAKPEVFTVHGCGVGHVQADGVKFPLEERITLPAGGHLIEVFIGNMTGLPCIYVENEREDGRIFSDGTWGADDFLQAVPVGTSSLYTGREQDPNEAEYEETVVNPVSVTEREGGTLVDFGRMVDGWPMISFAAGSAAAAGTGKEDMGDFSIIYGESEDEALDPVYCYYKEEHAYEGKKLRRRAFRYIYLPGILPGEVSISAVHQSIPLKVRASFHSNDDTINRIWEVAKNTYSLCSGLFFIDGIKRDRWIWSGDAYQSMMVNPYLYFDTEIDKRTSRALRGNTEMRQHINTIVDYTMLWLISVQNEYMMDGNPAYVREMFPKMEAAMDLLFSQTDEHGFLQGRARDWIYIDWADIDKEGPISAEQVLLWKCCKVMADCARLLAGQEGQASGEPSGRKSIKLGPDGRPLPADTVVPYYAPASEEEKKQLQCSAENYEKLAGKLRQAIIKYFWDEEKGALIDSFTSGKRNVTRHANIFAVLFDFADEKQKESILKNVLYNDSVPQIMTPYFKFFELDAFGKLGDLDRIWNTLHDYWGGMLERGAVTFWETFDPAQTGREQYGMYGDSFGKSLCHAWGASPIYLLGRYFLGVRPTSPGYRTYEVKPALQYFDTLDCTVPAGEKSVHIVLQGGKLQISEC